MCAGASISVWTPDWPVTSCEVSADSRYVVVSLAGRADIITLVLVHKSLPPLDETKPDDVQFGDENNKGKEFDLS